MPRNRSDMSSKVPLTKGSTPESPRVNNTARRIRQSGGRLPDCDIYLIAQPHSPFTVHRLFIGTPP